VAYMREVLSNVVDTVSQGHYKGEWTVYTSDIKTMDVEVVDLAKIPAKFWKEVEPEFRLADAKKAIKAGEEIPGVRVTEGTKHNLTIRG